MTFRHEPTPKRVARPSARTERLRSFAVENAYAFACLLGLGVVAVAIMLGAARM